MEKNTGPQLRFIRGSDEARPTSLASLARDLPPVVYFIETDDGLIKIGHTANLANRRSFFGRGWERVLAVTPGTTEDEQALHELYAEHLERGREYFRRHPDLVAHINGLRARLGVAAIGA